jgi:hypothetical protein
VPLSRMVWGLGRGCAREAGLVGRAKDIGQDGPDLFAAADEDLCDGWDR